jgi:hypothetical protein
MSQNLQKLSILSIEPLEVRSSTEKINGFFDCAELVVKRSGVLLRKCEPIGPSLFRIAEWVIILWLLIKH